MLTRITPVPGVAEEYLLAGVVESARTGFLRAVTEVIKRAQREIAMIAGLPSERVRIKAELSSE